MQILIYGKGRSGSAAAKLLSKDPLNKISFYNDDGCVSGGHIFNPLPRLTGAGNSECLITSSGSLPLSKIDMVIVSPGVPFDSPVLCALRSKGAAVMPELELGSRFAAAPITAITGTNGKSTTVSLLGFIYGCAGIRCGVLGNIGKALSEEAESYGQDDRIILEASSFQLEGIQSFKPHIAAVLNVTPDHLDRHKTMENYSAIKFNITKNQTESDYIILNADETYPFIPHFRADVYYASLSGMVRGAYAQGGKIYFMGETVCDADEVRLPGRHNLSNALFAVCAAALDGVPLTAVARGLKEFNGIPHRLEYCGSAGGVKFYNDSKGTNTASSLCAMRSFGEGTAVILGGSPKGEDFNLFAKSLPANVKYCALYGMAEGSLAEAIGGSGKCPFKVFGGFEAAIKGAYGAAKNNGLKTVLLSPACASFDLFRSYEERGAEFKRVFGEIAAAENVR